MSGGGEAGGLHGVVAGEVMRRAAPAAALTLMPCIRDMALRGRRARSVLIVLNAWILPAPARVATRLIKDTWKSEPTRVTHRK